MSCFASLHPHPSGQPAKTWKYGGSVPLSNQEVYDDDFELLWPADYASIGKQLGSTATIATGKSAGDLQFLCTDSKTSRDNKITHVAMVASESQIVHARGKAYGVCTNAVSLYSGKVCAVTRYNPSCTLRTGMKGFRTLQLQQALNALGASLTADGEYGSATASAVKAYQAAQGIPATGRADPATLKLLNLLENPNTGDETNSNNVRRSESREERSTSDPVPVPNTLRCASLGRARNTRPSMSVSGSPSG